MTPEQQARIVTEYIHLKKMAMREILHHENEAERYRANYRRAEIALERLLKEELWNRIKKPLQASKK